MKKHAAHEREAPEISYGIDAHGSMVQVTSDPDGSISLEGATSIRQFEPTIDVIL
jgi:hypothetical protein